uniref:Uncharacterized protein n=1 Tax=Janibacter limosus TaxID=53458 RepID=A0AC61U3B8_9MICO|nr:hypothetical protein [Janibacter limosus]
MDLRAAVDELYGVPLADFVATRTRLVTATKGDDPALAAEIKALRKPTVAAWLLNRVARDEPQVIADLEELGARMRSAQSQGDMPAPAQARPERRAAIDPLIAAAGRCAESSGATFGPSTRDEVDATAVAALADEQSGRALASGSLLRPLSYAGFGEVELDDAVATPFARCRRSPTTRRTSQPSPTTAAMAMAIAMSPSRRGRQSGLASRSCRRPARSCARPSASWVRPGPPSRGRVPRSWPPATGSTRVRHVWRM